MGQPKKTKKKTRGRELFDTTDEETEPEVKKKTQITHKKVKVSDIYSDSDSNIEVPLSLSKRLHNAMIVEDISPDSQSSVTEKTSAKVVRHKKKQQHKVELNNIDAPRTMSSIGVMVEEVSQDYDSIKPKKEEKLNKDKIGKILKSKKKSKVVEHIQRNSVMELEDISEDYDSFTPEDKAKQKPKVNKEV